MGARRSRCVRAGIVLLSLSSSSPIILVGSWPRPLGEPQQPHHEGNDWYVHQDGCENLLPQWPVGHRFHLSCCLPATTAAPRAVSGGVVDLPLYRRGYQLRVTNPRNRRLPRHPEVADPLVKFAPDCLMGGRCGIRPGPEPLGNRDVEPHVDTDQCPRDAIDPQLGVHWHRLSHVLDPLVGYRLSEMDL